MRMKYLFAILFTTLLFFSFAPNISFAQENVEENPVQNVELNEVLINENTEPKTAPEKDMNEDSTIVGQDIHKDEVTNEVDETDNSDSLVNETDGTEEHSSEDEITGDKESELDELEDGNLETEEELQHEDPVEVNRLEEVEMKTELAENEIAQSTISIASFNTQNTLSPDKVVELKKNLTQLGFGKFPSNPSINYGPVTEGVVKEFQEYYGLPTTGKADNVTLNKLLEVLNPPYKDGDRGLHITELKKDLTKLGFGRFPSNPSIFYGKVTTRVVKEFQGHYSLGATGIADQITLSKIQEILSSKYTNGKKGNHVKKLKLDLTTLGFGKFPKNPSVNYGNVTSRVVSEFQDYYNLPVSGIADEVTLRKIKEVLNPPFKKGSRGQAIVELKKNLHQIGFGSFSSKPSIFYDNATEKAVKDFQVFFNLEENGIATKETLDKINQIITNPFKNGSKGKHITQLKKHLTFLGFGKFPSNPSVNYGNVTSNVVKEFQKYYGLSDKSGIGNRETIRKMNEILNSPYKNGEKGTHVRQLKLDLSKLGFGRFPSNPSQNYGNVTERVVKEFQSSYNLKVNGIFDSVSQKTLEERLNELNQKIKIFIDPGHGGRDPGATSNGSQEKDFVLDIAKQIEKYLKPYKNVTIKLSRTNDTFLELQERTKMANDWGADYFVSVHINAGGGTGFESYIFEKRDENNKVIASPTQDEIKKQDIIHSHIASNISERDRGKKRANFHVLRESNMSAILFEYLFIDTTSDRNKLKDKNYIEKLGRLTAEGIAKAFNLKK